MRSGSVGEMLGRGVGITLLLAWRRVGLTRDIANSRYLVIYGTSYLRGLRQKYVIWKSGKASG